MALREKLVERAAPYLEPGEQVQAVFVGQSGPSPYWSLLTAWIVILQAGYRTFVVTDRAIVVLRNGRLSGTKAKALHLRGPRNVVLGPATGLWGQIQLDTRYWVHKRFHKDIAAADAALQAMQGGGHQPQQGYAPPPQQGYAGPPPGSPAAPQGYPQQPQQQYPAPQQYPGQPQ
jgi:hypothetical protein